MHMLLMFILGGLAWAVALIADICNPGQRDHEWYDTVNDINLKDGSRMSK